MNTHEYTCDLCNKKFNNLEDAQAHATKPCGHIRESGIGVETEEPENSIEFDCTKCKAIFKSKADFYDHANKCSQVLDPLLCEKCNIELVSKAGLKKHIEKCKAKSTTKHHMEDE